MLSNRIKPIYKPHLSIFMSNMFNEQKHVKESAIRSQPCRSFFANCSRTSFAAWVIAGIV